MANSKHKLSLLYRTIKNEEPESAPGSLFHISDALCILRAFLVPYLKKNTTELKRVRAGQWEKFKKW